MGMLPGRHKFRVAGLVHTGLFEFDSQWAYIALPAAQRLFENGQDRVTQVEVRIADIYAVRATARRILDALGGGFMTYDWINLNQSLFAALWLEKVAIGITIGLIVMVAALNIVATLILMVMEKHQDIAILVSLGASRGAIARIFMLQGPSSERPVRSSAPFSAGAAATCWTATTSSGSRPTSIRSRTSRSSCCPPTCSSWSGGPRDLLPGHHPARSRRGARRPGRGPAL